MSQEQDWIRLFNNPTEKGAMRYAKRYMGSRVRHDPAGRPRRVAKFDPEALLAGVHKARIRLAEPGHSHPSGVRPTPQQVIESREWLQQHGFQVSGNF